MRTLTFTIAIPVRNGERFLAAAIESALAQSRPADEVMVVDDGSTDGTRAIATDAKWRGRIRYVYNDKTTGCANAFNRAARLAASELVVFLSSDDLLDPSFLQIVEGGLLTYPEAKFCYAAAKYIGAEGKPLHAVAQNSQSPPRLYDGKTYVHNYLAGCLNGEEIHRLAGVVVERRLFDECQFRKEAGIMADNDFFIRIAARTNVVGIAEPLASVRVHADSISSRLESLNLRVSEDYLYQVRFLIAHPEHIAAEDMLLVHTLAFRNLAELLSEALLRGRPDLYAAAVRIMRELVLAIGPEASRKSIAKTGNLLCAIYRWSWARYLYKAAVAAASVAKLLKRMRLRILLARRNRREEPKSARLREV